MKPEPSSAPWRLQGHHQTHPDGGGPETSGAEISDIFERQEVFQTTPEGTPMSTQPWHAFTATPPALLDSLTDIQKQLYVDPSAAPPSSAS